MKIVITKFAETKLKEIYLYYSREASVSIAKAIKNKILHKIKLLINNQNIGAKDEYLKHLSLCHRKLIEGNYKIVYRFTNSIDCIYNRYF